MKLGRNIGRKRTEEIIAKKIKKTQHTLQQCRKDLKNISKQRQKEKENGNFSLENYFLSLQEDELKNNFIPKFEARLEKLYKKYEQLTGKKMIEEDAPQKQ